jgi:hypothetical protein
MSEIALFAALVSITREVSGRVSQTVFPFKLDTAEDTITAYAGLVSIGEYLHAVELPGPSNPVGDQPSAYRAARVWMPRGEL